MQLKIHLLHPDASLPTYAHNTDSGMDLCAIEDTIIPPGERQLISTGIAIELPPNTEAQIRPRSGLAYKHGITVLNSPGTIDEGYRGEIKVILINHSRTDFHINQGMRIAQMVIAPVLRPALEIIRDFPHNELVGSTTRGANGFGSTGV